MGKPEGKSRRIQKESQHKKADTKRTTRGIKLGNLNENALAKKSAITAAEQKRAHGDRHDENEVEGCKMSKKVKTQKQLDKELRKQYDKGKAYEEDEDDRADRKNFEA